MTTVRSYKVTVSATDRTGNSESAVCEVAVAPKKDVGGNTFTQGDLDEIQMEVVKTVERFNIASISWNYTQVAVPSNFFSN